MFKSSVLFLVLFAPIVANGAVFKPKKEKDFFKITVRILGFDEKSGGTGAILESTKSGSVILSNAHVCEVVKNGGIVDPPSHNRVLITGIKMFKGHDLCLVKVGVNLGITLKIANKEPEAGDKAVISGHPALLPTIVTRGHFSENHIISVNYGTKPCTNKQKADPRTGLLCDLMGGFPDVRHLESKVISATIMPGSSGSPVFNEKGEIAAVIFAGMGQLAYGFAVPLEFVREFLAQARSMEWKLAESESEEGEPLANQCKSSEKLSVDRGAVFRCR